MTDNIAYNHSSIEEVSALSSAISSGPFVDVESNVRKLLEIVICEEQSQPVRDLAKHHLLAQTEALSRGMTLAVTKMYDRLLKGTSLSLADIELSMRSEAAPSSSNGKQKLVVVKYSPEEWPIFCGTLLNFRTTRLTREVRIFPFKHTKSCTEIIVRYLAAEEQEVMEVYIHPSAVQRSAIFECCLREACIDAVRGNIECFEVVLGVYSAFIHGNDCTHRFLSITSQRLLRISLSVPSDPILEATAPQLVLDLLTSLRCMNMRRHIGARDEMDMLISDSIVLGGISSIGYSFAISNLLRNNIAYVMKFGQKGSVEGVALSDWIVSQAVYDGMEAGLLYSLYMTQGLLPKDFLNDIDVPSLLHDIFGAVLQLIFVVDRSKISSIITSFCSKYICIELPQVFLEFILHSSMHIPDDNVLELALKSYILTCIEMTKSSQGVMYSRGYAQIGIARLIDMIERCESVSENNDIRCGFLMNSMFAGSKEFLLRVARILRVKYGPIVELLQEARAVLSMCGTPV